jgi:pimeloyl-ACP methyl ester carboxylesterase
VRLNPDQEETVEDRSDDAPPLTLFLTEPGRALAELGLYFAALPALPALPQGDGHPVLVLPGLLADDTSTRALRAVLRRLGYAVYGWRLGRNIGPTAESVQGLRSCVSDLTQRHGRTVSLIGWSLGGIFAREQAREMPRSVRQVITLASPFRLARPDQTRVHQAFQRYSHLHVKHQALPLERDDGPLPVPATSVYSHLDGIVAWETCLDTTGPRAENIAVLASHLGIGHHPAAIYAVADRLAQAEGSWKPFRPPPALRPAFPRPDQPAGAVAA